MEYSPQMTYPAYDWLSPGFGYRYSDYTYWYPNYYYSGYPFYGYYYPYDYNYPYFRYPDYYQSPTITGYSYKGDMFCANHYSTAQLDAMKAAGFLPIAGPITKCVISYEGIGAPLSAYIPRSIANVIRMYKDKGATPIYG